MNTRGELVGINSQILSPSGGNIGIGFAIPSNMARNVTEQLVGKGKVRRGQLGVGVQPVTSDIAASMGLKQARGVLINSVTPGGAADKAGLKAGDIITALNGKAVDDTNVLRNEIAQTVPGTAVTLTILRDGHEQQIHATLGEYSAANRSPSQPGGGPAAGGSQLGIEGQTFTPDMARQLGVPANTKGFVVTGVDPSGPAAGAGIQAGDVIVQVNRQDVQSAADIRSALQKSGDRPPLLLINRAGQTIFVPVPLR